MATGSYTGDGDDDRPIAGLGFQPDYLIIKGDLAQPAVFRISTMTGDISKAFATSDPVRPNRIQSLDPDGFTLGNDPAVNNAGVSYQWIAFRAEPGLMAVGSYLGDGQPLNIVGTDFMPDYVLVAAESDAKPWHRMGTMPTDQSLPFDDGPPGFNEIQKFRVDGFKIGTSPEVNFGGWAFHWVAFKADPGRLELGTYLGNGLDDRPVTGTAQTPAYLAIASDVPYSALHRSAGQGPGDRSLRFDDRPDGTNEIQALLPTGFETGSAAAVNADSASYYWAAFGNGIVGADLALTQTVEPHFAAVGDTVAYTIRLHNLGTLDATGVAVCDTLPGDLVFLDAVPSVGGYVLADHLWSVGGLAVGDTATLALRAVVSAGSGLEVFNTAAICAADQVDPDPRNDSATSSFDLVAPNLTDLALALTTADTLVNGSQTVDLTLTLENLHPAEATGVEVLLQLPAELAFLGASPSDGAYDNGTGVWSLGDVGSGENPSLDLTAALAGGAPGDTLTPQATILSLDQTDTRPANDTAMATLRIAAADLRVSKTVDNVQPFRTDTIRYTILLENLGPDTATNPVLTEAWPVGLSLEGADAGSGLYDELARTWALPQLAPGQRDTLRLTASFDSLLTQPDVTNSVSVTAVDQGDPVPANNAAEVALTVAASSPLSITAPPFVKDTRLLLPGTGSDEILALTLGNGGIRRETLQALSLSNLAADPARQDTLDAAWDHLELVVSLPGGETVPVDTPPRTFVDGRLTFADLALHIEAGQSLNLLVRGTVSLQARDGEALRVSLDAPADLVFTNEVSLDGAWPLVSYGTLLVDGMTADQIQMHPVPPAVLQVGSSRNLALDFTIPANGYLSDTLTKLNVANFGNAAPAEDITAMEAWVDNGDGLFDVVSDRFLCPLYSTGGRWEHTGLGEPVPLGGLRVFVTVDINEMALTGSVRLGLPGPDDFGLGLSSGNDGPVDRDLLNAYSQSISASDRLILSTGQIPADPVHPGDSLALLDLITQNIYAEPHTLRRLTLRNLSLGRDGATGGAMDDRVLQLFLHLDGDGDGLLDDPATDPILGTAVFEDGTAVFDGLTWTVAAGETRHLFVSGDLSLDGASDGDRIGVALTGSADMSFTQPVSLVANWPLQSNTGRTVNGMVADQVGVRAVPAVTMAPNEGPVLAMDLTLPANGSLADTLNVLEIANLGTATASDFSAVNLWLNRGGSGFDALEDSLLGSLAAIADHWRIQDLDLPMAPEGLPLLVTLQVGPAPTNGATLQFVLPTGGVSVASDNDGPLDVALASPTTLLLSTAPLLSDLVWVRDRSVEGQTTSLLMVVRNKGGETINGIVPSDPAFTGPGAVTVLGTFNPPAIDLLPAQVDTFVWTCSSDVRGGVQVAGNCTGIGSVGGQVRSSLKTTSPIHRILQPVGTMGLYPVGNMPFSINRGQEGVVPLTLTLLNPGGPETADAELRRLTVALDDGNGNGLVPADLLSLVVVNEGLNIYEAKSDLETAGSDIVLDLTEPVIISGNEPSTLSLRLNILGNTLAESFRISIPDSTWLEAYDAISGQRVPIQLEAGTFPVQSSPGTLVGEAVGLSVDRSASAPLTAGQGQTDVPLLSLQLDSQGTDASSSDVEIGSFGVSLVDTNGLALVNPHLYLERIRVVGPLQVHAEASVSAADDTSMILALSPPFLVPVGSPPLTLDLVGDLVESSLLGSFRLQLRGPVQFDARDGNTGSSIPVSFTATPMAGNTVTIQRPAAEIVVTARPLLPPVVPLGAGGIRVFSCSLTNPGVPGTGDVLADSMHIILRDGARNPLAPAPYLDRVYLMSGDQVLGEGLPSSQDMGLFSVPVAGFRLRAQQTLDLDLYVDFEANAPLGGVEFVLTSEVLHVTDANLGSAVVVRGAAPGDLPLGSGLARLQAPPDFITVGFTDRMPSMLAADGGDLPVAVLHLENPATIDYAPVAVGAITLRGADDAGRPLILGDAVAAVHAFRNGEPWGHSGPLAASDSTAVVTGAAPLGLPPGQPLDLELRLELRAGTGTTSLRIGLTETDIHLTSGGGGLDLPVLPAGGATFPLWTAPGSMVTLDLAGSYSNFPNPFAAGREATTFVFALRTDATVSLKLLTVRGETVVTLLDREPLAAGLHQETTWTGLNARGATVHNGVYLAEITVDFADGGQERLLRKVAVVR